MDIAAETVVQAFIQGWISRFGIPSTVTTDTGCQFKSSLWKILCNCLVANVSAPRRTTLLQMD